MIYLILFFLFFILSLKYDYFGCKKNRNYAYWFSVSLLIFISGFRYHVGLDSIRLSEWYQTCPNIFNLNFKFIEEESRYQPLWILLCSLLKTITPDFVLLQFVQSAIVNILLFKFVKEKTPYIFSCLLIYFLLAYVVLNFEIMRESLAISISLYAVLNYEKKKLVKFLVLLFIAYEIHVSVIIMIIFPLVYNIRIKIIHITTLLIIVIFFNMYYTKYMDLIFSVLLSNNDTISKHILTYSYAGDIGNSMKYYISIYLTGLLLPMLFLYIRNTRFNEKYKYSSLIVLYSMFTLLGNESVAFLRFANYQLIFYIILIAETYQYILKKFNTPYLTGLLFCFVISFTFVYSLFKPVPDLNNAKTYCRYYPYNSIFQKEKIIIGSDGVK